MKILEQILQEIDKKEEEYFYEEHGPGFSMGSCSMASDIKEIIRSHMEDDGWIPVAELLPEKTIETFDGVFSSEVVAVTIMNEEGELYRGCDFLLGDRWACASKNEKVLAWQPLPAPYQPKEEKNEI